MPVSALTTKRTVRVVLKIATNIQGKNPVGVTAANTNPVTIGGVDGDNDIVCLVLNSDGSVTAKLGAGTSIVGKFIPVDADGTEKFTTTNPAIVDSNFDGGIATGGSKTTIADTSKNFETNMFAGNVARVTISGVDYYRTVASNTATILTIATLPGAAASAIVGTLDTAEVTVVYVNEGVAGNSITAEVVAAPGDNDNLSASFTDNVLTVYLGKTAGELDDTKNTATLVAVKIDELAEFTATMTGSDGVVPVTVTPVEFSGGVAVVSASSGSVYQIMRKNVIADGGGSITVDQSIHDNFNANANLQVGNADVAAGNPIPAVLTALPVDAATETTLAELEDKDFATQTTLAAVLAKIIASPATESKQDTLIAKDFATQTTLAAILAKIIAAPATEATLAAVQATLAQGGIPATTLETTHQNAATTDGNGTAATVSGYGPISFQITGTPDGATVTWEGSVDGTNYTAFSATKTDTGVEATTATAEGIYSTNVSGYKSVRAVISTAGAGTSLTVKSLAVGVARPLTANVTTVGSSAHDAAATGNPVQVGGVYRTTDPVLADGDAGSIRVNAKGEALVQVTGSLMPIVVETLATSLNVPASSIVYVTNLYDFIYDCSYTISVREINSQAHTMKGNVEYKDVAGNTILSQELLSSATGSFIMNRATLRSRYIAFSINNTDATNAHNYEVILTKFYNI